MRRFLIAAAVVAACVAGWVVAEATRPIQWDGPLTQGPRR